MIRIPKMQGDGPMIGTAASFACCDFEVIIVVPNRQLLDKFVAMSGIRIQDNVFEAMLAPMEHVEIVGAPGMAHDIIGRG